MERIKTSELQEGMYVDLGKGWLEHPFLRRTFLLNDSKQINKICEYLDYVSYCPERSSVISQKQELIQEPEPELPPETEIVETKCNAEEGFEPPSQKCWEERNKPTENLAAAIQSDQPSAEKAQAIFQHSTELMDTLLSQAPTAELIYESSEAIKDLAGFIVEDDEVSNRLLAITSHDYYT